MREGLSIFENLQNSQGIMWALYNLGAVLRFKGNFADAKACYERGMRLAESSEDRLGILGFKRGLSMVAANEGRLVEAREGLETIIPLLRENNELALAGALGNLAQVHHHQGDYDTAFEIGNEGLELARKTKKWVTVRWILKELAETEIERGNYESSLSLAQQALKFYERSGLFSEENRELKALIEEVQKKLVL